MKKTFLALACLIGSLCISAATEDKVLMTINGDPIMASEFMYIYQKNNKEASIEPKSVDEYLDLFINFKLKVKEAESLGLDTTETFKKELHGYRAQATPKYMQDNEAIDSLIRISYQRMSFDRRAAHIAIECPANAPDSVKKAALAKINEARQRVTTGVPVTTGKGKKAKTICIPEKFEDVAKVFSTDPSVKDNGGELGWIIPFRFIYAFENAVYTTPVGQVSEVFSTPYGYHIAYVTEERPHEEVHAAHIMKMVPGGDSTLSESAKMAMDSIYAMIENGADFAETATRLSDDKGSAMRGGDLDWFGRGVMVAPFEQTVFGMTQEGEVSKPFQSRFGWHIVKMMGKRGILPLDSIRSQIERKVQRDERMIEAEKSFIRKTKAEYKLSDDMSDEEVRAYADAHLEEKYEDLRYLVNEYHDGILLFDVSLENVWDKASKDTEGLTAYFNAHKKEYKWDAPRYKGYMIYAKDAIAAKQAKAIISNAEKDSISGYINQRINNDSVKFVKIEHGLWTKGQSKAVDVYGFRDKKATYEADPEFPIVMPLGKVLKNPEEYADERGKVTSAYQDKLEKEWIETLRKKYEVKIDQDVFNELKTGLK